MLASTNCSFCSFCSAFCDPIPPAKNTLRGTSDAQHPQTTDRLADEWDELEARMRKRYRSLRALKVYCRAVLDRVTNSAEAKKLLQAMSDFLAAQKSLSAGFDTVWEVVTPTDQKLGLASSGTVTLVRPDKVRVARSGGFADFEILFDGKTLTLLGKNANLYTQAATQGTVDQLIDELRDKYNRPLPGADLLMSDSYRELMEDVYDSKDLGSGVVNGVECDTLAFRKKDVDWQIWVAQGDHPYPCRFVVTPKMAGGDPQYTIQFRDWKFGSDVAADDFAFKNVSNAKEVALKDVQDKLADLPANFTMGAAK
jgi:hypothetical protein